MNKQIVEELRSAYIYLGMSAWAEDQGLKGLADFMKTHAEKEEYKHAMKFVKYIQKTGGNVEFGTIERISITSFTIKSNFYNYPYIIMSLWCYIKGNGKFLMYKMF